MIDKTLIWSCECVNHCIVNINASEFRIRAGNQVNQVQLKSPPVKIHLIWTIRNFLICVLALLSGSDGSFKLSITVFDKLHSMFLTILR